MKELERQQQLEEQALLASTNGKSGGPVRSRSGNDLASFNGDASTASKYAAAKSMPGSRRHSGELKEGEAKDAADGAAARKLPNGAQQQRDADGKPMLNSFLFDDELDADLQSASSPSWPPPCRRKAALTSPPPSFRQTRPGAASTSR